MIKLVYDVILIIDYNLNILILIKEFDKFIKFECLIKTLFFVI